LVESRVGPKAVTSAPSSVEPRAAKLAENWAECSVVHWAGPWAPTSAASTVATKVATKAAPLVASTVEKLAVSRAVPMDRNSAGRSVGSKAGYWVVPRDETRAERKVAQMVARRAVN